MAKSADPTLKPLEAEAEQARVLLQTLSTVGATLADEPDQTIQDLLEGETSFVEALSAAVSSIQYDEALAQAAEAMRDEIEARMARIRDRAQIKRQAVLYALQSADLASRKFELPQGTVYVAKTGGTAVEVTDETLIPARFWKTEPKLVKSDISKAIKAGEEVPGAKLAEARETLTIKTR